jgi:hypothetical protein
MNYGKRLDRFIPAAVEACSGSSLDPYIIVVLASLLRQMIPFVKHYMGVGH